MQQRLISPLRYPGSKAKLASYISGLLSREKMTGCTVYEPFAGGASVSLHLVSTGIAAKAILCEKDPLVFAFWESVFKHPDKLCELIRKADVSVDAWLKQEKYRSLKSLEGVDIVKVGFAGLFLNRTNFSGIIGGGPIGGYKQESPYGIGCRFNKQRLIKQIFSIADYADKFEIYNEDCVDFLERNKKRIKSEKAFVYLDPPYFTQGKNCYRHFFNSDDHSRLAKFITKQRYDWLISYDDHPSLPELYLNQVSSLPLHLDYSARSVKRGQEILISNIDLPQPVYRLAKKRKATTLSEVICAVNAA